MKRNVGKSHWWRWTVLTDKNPDPLKRPVFDDDTARRIFEELDHRELLQSIDAVEQDGSGAQAYLMRYDIEGWDRAVSDGRPVRGTVAKIKRNWLQLLVAFLLGCLLTTLQNHVVGLIDAGVKTVLRSPKSSTPSHPRAQAPQRPNSTPNTSLQRTSPRRSPG